MEADPRFPLTADQEALLQRRYPSYGSSCLVFWGTHGCSLPEGHAGEWHECRAGTEAVHTKARQTGPWRDGAHGAVEADAEVVVQVSNNKVLTWKPGLATVVYL